ncbi:Leucine-rich receptor-like protein kinase family protein [Forsythia ovata]|uniref:Leucine-rich receptor-like protein kinase family protein n=1 Tax=Forsythia ovata TaxID=205694 RepID=A0ABD1QCD6_9LAMI
MKPLLGVNMRVFGLFMVALCFVPALGQLPSQDILALLEFKKGIKHDPTGFVVDSWNDESIDFNGCPASWNGIMCTGGNVAAVVLDNLGLSADVDLSVFANLTMLVKLSISNNSITGILSKNIGDFKSLEYLDVSDNLFFSSLPPEIGNLRSLKNLSLAGNNFSGSIPDTVSGLASIHSLDMSRNSLSGPLPSKMTRLTGLVYLNLSVNGFTKKIPKGFEMMTQLEVLDLHGNMLDGNLDPELLQLTTAIHVDLSGNLLVNSAKEEHNFLPSISPTVNHLNLSHNQLTGSLVSSGEVGAFGNLKVLDLSYNQLSGELPGFNFVYDLQVLKLSNNKFSGFIPNNLLKGDSLVLTELDLSGNNLTGPISIITSTTLRVLNLSSNVLSGELPLLTGSCTVIDLSKNQFEGNLTRMLKWGNIEILDLSQNRLSGSIPEVTAQFLRLNYLNLSRNSLNGSLPKVITLFPKLTVLDVSFNQLEGPLLTALLTSSTLQELHLQNNKLTGNINLSPRMDESNLRVLDLSHNQLSGYYPDGFGSLTGLQMLNIGGNSFSGSLPTSLGENSTLTSFDISQNHFTGPLPKNLPNSLQSFNASYNDLSGVVPENLRKFPLSCFYPGNSKLQFPNPPPDSNHVPSGNRHGKHMKTIIKVVVIIACVIAVVILILLAIFIYYKHISKRPSPHVTNKDVHRQTATKPSSFAGRDSGGSLVVSAEDLVTGRKGSSSEIISPDEKMAAITGFSPSKTSHFSWSPESGDSYAADNLSRLDVRSPDRLPGELYFLDDTISFTAEELSRAPAEVLGRSSHGTSYRATLDSGLFLTVKWLREGVAKPRKEFAKEAKKFANIRHPNVVGLRGYYWGPTQHEKLILSEYISPGSLASFLYDRPGRKGPPLTWPQRLKIAVDIARGLNYLHFDPAVPHGNLKASNVLLDGPDLNARIADYCLHRLMTQSGTVEQILDAGVLGYRAPELAASKKPLPSFKSDVYAFGVILLELLTGKCAGDVVSGEDGGVDLTDWVRLRVAEGRGSDCFDAALTPDMGIPASEKGMKEVLGMALRCIRSVSERPGIKTIYEDLSSI